MLILCGVGDRLLNGIKKKCVDSEAFVRINGVKYEWFNVSSGMKQGYPVSIDILICMWLRQLNN